ncbi:PREDICTED: matrix metalloproteinase-17-like [Poecilia mexicana]|nr:PREDICTED: matrix metalloproteinase-17-like [Poecilia mexicana]
MLRSRRSGMELLLWMMMMMMMMILNFTGRAVGQSNQYSRAVDWLSRYGYLPPPDPRTSKLQTKEGIEQAIRVMQRFGGIQETGLIDSETLKLMSTPRCSLPDIVGGEEMRRRRRRRKRYALSGLKWHKTDLTWSVHSFPSRSSIRPEEVKILLALALKAWSDAAPLNFRELPGDGEAGGDIRVSFASLLHNDGYPFDGQGGTLAHAFFPGMDEVCGDTHFDDHETWSYREGGSTTDLFTVAVHEFGHALGLSHSSTDPSIMRPYYQGPVGDASQYKLDLDDRLAIQQLYGARDDTQPGGVNPDPPLFPTPLPPRPTRLPEPSSDERCQGSFDAVANIRGEVFFFRGAHFWRTKRDGSLVSLRPAVITNFWIGLPTGTNKVDAVYERKSDSKIIFFIGSQYWVFSDTKVMSGYPRPLSDWRMTMPSGAAVDRVDAAFVWAHNGKTYLFSGGQFWRFDESQRTGNQEPDPGYPRSNDVWTGMPTHMDDVITWGEGDAYFFKGDFYWVMKDGGINQEYVSPKATGMDWLRCPSPPPTAVPQDPGKPKECICAFNRSSLRNDCLLLVAVMLIISGLISVNN